MLTDYSEIMNLVANDVIDNYNVNDTNEMVEDWLKDTYPDFDFIVRNDLIKPNMNAIDIIEDDIVIVKNAKDLEDKLFDFEDDKWTISKEGF